jgi:hypothetical protein
MILVEWRLHLVTLACSVTSHWFLCLQLGALVAKRIQCHDAGLGSPSRPTKLHSMEDFPYEDLSGAIESTDHHVPSIKKHLLQSPVRKIKKRRLSLPAVRP